MWCLAQACKLLHFQLISWSSEAWTIEGKQQEQEQELGCWSTLSHMSNESIFFSGVTLCKCTQRKHISRLAHISIQGQAHHYSVFALQFINKHDNIIRMQQLHLGTSCARCLPMGCECVHLVCFLGWSWFGFHQHLQNYLTSMQLDRLPNLRMTNLLLLGHVTGQQWVELP